MRLEDAVMGSGLGGPPALAMTGLAGLRGARGRVMAAGERLFREGDDRLHIFVVESGWLKLTRTLRDGQRQIVGFPTRGSILGFESPRDYLNDCEALTSATVHSISPSTIARLCRDPGIGETLLDQIGAQLGASQTQVASVGAQSAAQKMATFLISLADRGMAADDEFTLPMSRGDIGDFLGLRLETVSRLMGAFRQHGWIALPAVYRCRISNRRALTALSTGARTMTSLAPSRAIGPRRARRPRV